MRFINSYIYVFIHLSVSFLFLFFCLFISMLSFLFLLNQGLIWHPRFRHGHALFPPKWRGYQWSPGAKPRSVRLTENSPWVKGRFFCMLAWRVTQIASRSSRIVFLRGNKHHFVLKRFLTTTPFIMSSENGIGGSPAEEKVTLGYKEIILHQIF